MAGRNPKGEAMDRSGFAALLADVKRRIQTAQTRAVLAVNSELVRLYWDIGRIIAERHEREGWGAAVIPRLALKLKNELPDLKGFSERNIKRMLALLQGVPQPLRLVATGGGEIGPIEESAAGCGTRGVCLKSAAACGTIP